jgi:hypothetical protein
MHRTATLAALFIAALPCVACVPLEIPAEVPDDTPLNPPEQTVASHVAVRYAGPPTADELSPGVPRPSAADRPRPDPRPFRLGAGRGVLGSLDLGPCREQGLAPGYVHVRVTFENTGHVVRAAVESPEQPPEGALACIGEQLQTVALVPAFDGSEFTVSRSYFVN